MSQYSALHPGKKKVKLRSERKVGHAKNKELNETVQTKVMNIIIINGLLAF